MLACRMDSAQVKALHVGLCEAGSHKRHKGKGTWASSNPGTAIGNSLSGYSARHALSEARRMKNFSVKLCEAPRAASWK